MFYVISKAPDDRLKDDFIVDHSYDKGQISLEIDLTDIDPKWTDSSI